ncbi:kyphoscoliosis peptidase-like [Crassostrea virginica]
MGCTCSSAISKSEHAQIHKSRKGIKEDKDDKSMKNGGVTLPKLSSGKSQEANIAFENEDSLIGDDVKPKPTRKKKSAIMFDPKMFEEIDSHVARTPNSVCKSIPTLVEYLIQPAHTSLQRARAVYKCVTTNIAYDIDGYQGRSQKKSCDSDDVLRNPSSVCGGYSNLFESLCRCARIPVIQISGYAKGYSHKVTEDFDLSKIESNHAWNAIFIEGEWRLVDSTWDAGYIDGKSFHWKKQDFLMDPEYFVNSHLPYTEKDQVVSKSWQLLDNPVDPKTFFKSLKLEQDSIKES